MRYRQVTVPLADVSFKTARIIAVWQIITVFNTKSAARSSNGYTLNCQLMNNDLGKTSLLFTWRLHRPPSDQSYLSIVLIEHIISSTRHDANSIWKEFLYHHSKYSICLSSVCRLAWSSVFSVGSLMHACQVGHPSVLIYHTIFNNRTPRSDT